MSSILALRGCAMGRGASEGSPGPGAASSLPAGAIGPGRRGGQVVLAAQIDNGPDVILLLTPKRLAP